MSTVPATYKAYVYEQYGKCADVLKIAQLPAGPLAAGSVRIKVHSASINPVDYVIVEMMGEVFTRRKPSTDKPYRFGFDAAGVVAEVGEGVSEFKVGDQVYAISDLALGQAEHPTFGTVAEYVDIEAKFVAPKPTNITYDEAASVPVAALTSYQGIFNHGNVRSGQRVLVLGGSSSCGLYAIQFAKSVGAYVIATTSAKNSDFVKSIGADETIDYHSQKWVDVLEKHSIDLIYDCGMEPASWNTDAQVVLKHGGRFVALLEIPSPIESPIGATQEFMFVQGVGSRSHQDWRANRIGHGQGSRGLGCAVREARGGHHPRSVAPRRWQRRREGVVSTCQVAISNDIAESPLF